MRGIGLKAWWDHPFSRLIAMCIISGIIGAAIYLLKGSSYWYSVPLALLSASVVGYFFEAYEFRKFLEDRISEVFVKDEFVEKLSHEKLGEIQDKIYQTYYRISEEPTERSLYRFVKNNVLVYLDKAFDKESESVVDLFFKEEGYFKVKYTRKFKVSSLKEEETEVELEILYAVRRIPEKGIAEHFLFDECYLKIDGVYEVFENTKEFLSEDGSVFKFSYPLKYTVTKDSLLTVEYKLVVLEISEERVHHQLFKRPTEGFKLNINVHDFGDCEFSHKFSGAIPPSHEQINKTDRRFEIDYDKWMLPMNSFTVYFNRKREK
ncbi:MAG: hypothetical protein ACFFCW_18945 [Candidatus Hodarchaeota archaeon]